VKNERTLIRRRQLREGKGIEIDLFGITSSDCDLRQATIGIQNSVRCPDVFRRFSFIIERKRNDIAADVIDRRLDELDELFGCKILKTLSCRRRNIYSAPRPELSCQQSAPPCEQIRRPASGAAARIEPFRPRPGETPSCCPPPGPLALQTETAGLWSPIFLSCVRDCPHLSTANPHSRRSVEMRYSD